MPAVVACTFFKPGLKKQREMGFHEFNATLVCTASSDQPGFQGFVLGGGDTWCDLLKSSNRAQGWNPWSPKDPW